MILEVALRVVGGSMVGLAVLHVFFSKHLGWREDFAKVSLLNRQIFYVHCTFICLILTLMGLLCLAWPGALMQPTPLGILVAGGLAVFWFCRLLAQWFIYDSRLWRGKSFETLMHVFFSGLWILYTVVFSLVWWQQWLAR